MISFGASLVVFAGILGDSLDVPALFGRGPGSVFVCEVTYEWSVALAMPLGMFERSSFSPKRKEFQSNNHQFHDIPCLTRDSIFNLQFHNCGIHRAPVIV